MPANELAVGSGPTRRVVVLGVPPIIELDLVGPASVFSRAARLSHVPWKYDVVVASSERGPRMDGDSGLTLVPHVHIGDLVEPIDTLIVSCGESITRMRPDEVLCAWLRAARESTRRIASVCLGAFALAMAGLLDGEQATTHWAYADLLARRFPGVRVDPDPIWTRSGKIYTSGGVTAGLDLALALVEEDLGSEIALEVARHLVVSLRRPSGQTPFSVAERMAVGRSRGLAELRSWIAENLSQPLPVEAMAGRMEMSPRHFARIFAAEMGTTPARYVRQARIEGVRMLLERTQCDLDEIAARCGFGSVEGMRRIFVEFLHLTPDLYRAHFGPGELRHS